MASSAAWEILLDKEEEVEKTKEEEMSDIDIWPGWEGLVMTGEDGTWEAVGTAEYSQNLGSLPGA